MTHCLNCNYELQEGQKFCPECGQKAALKRLTLHDIWHDVVHYFTHADKGIFQLLKALTFQTGSVAREFVQGKRKKYFPPLNFFLIVAALYVVMNAVFPNRTATGQQRNSNSSYQAAPQKAAVSATTIKAYEKQARLGRFFAKYANYVAMFAAPYISLLIWLIYLRGPYNFTEHLVANLYLIGYTNLVRCMIWIPLLSLLTIQSDRWPNYVFAAFEVIYRSVFYYHFTGKYTTAGKLQSLALAILSVIAWWLLIAGVIFVYYSIPN